MRRFVFFVSVVCFGLMGVAVVKGNEKQPATVEAKAAAEKSKIEKSGDKGETENASDPKPTEEPVDADQRRLAVEFAVQNFRVFNECYQLEVGAPDAVFISARDMKLPVDKLKERLDELGVQQMPDDIRAELEAKVNRQYDIGWKYGVQGRQAEIDNLLLTIGTKFFADLDVAVRWGEVLSRREYYGKMLELTDLITEALEKNL